MKLNNKTPLKLQKTNVKVLTYGESTPSLRIQGKTMLLIEANNKLLCKEFHVVDTNNNNLLSGKTEIELSLLVLPILPPPVTVNNTDLHESKFDHVPEHLRPLVTKYKNNLFSGKIGKIEGVKIKLHINKEMPPVAQKERRIPFALRDKVMEHIKLLESHDIIEDITNQSTPWLNQMTIVPKGQEDIRVCIDMRCANKAIERTRFPTPTVDDLLHKLSGAKHFSKLDLNNAFHQLELDESCRYITAFQTENRIKRYKRLLFGVNSASEELQHALRTILGDIAGTINIADDILVYAKSQTEHDEILAKVLQRLADRGVTLNLEKCKFSKSNLEYYGYVFSNQGMHPSEGKIRSLKQMEKPEDAKAVRSFLGLTNYLKRFIPQYSTVTNPLRELLRKETPLYGQSNAITPFTFL